MNQDNNPQGIFLNEARRFVAKAIAAHDRYLRFWRLFCLASRLEPSRLRGASHEQRVVPMTMGAYYFEMLGTAVFAITGVLAVTRRGLDVFGALVLGVVTALGGEPYATSLSARRSSGSTISTTFGQP